MSRHHIIAVLLIVLTVAVFWRVHDHRFVWDDRIDIYENPHLNSETAPDILVFWQKPYQHLYIPLTYTVWATIARFSKVPATPEGINLNPRPFHIANLIVHLLSVIMVFAILRLLVPSDWAAGAGSLLFALHPVQVESVAWVDGMRDVLAGLLSFVALWQYLAYARATSTGAVGNGEKETGLPAGKGGVFRLDRKTLHYAAATLAYVLALLAKPSAVVVPAVAWLLDYWVLRRSLRQSTVALVAWLVLAVPFVILTRWAQPEDVIYFITPLWARPFVAGDAIAFYMNKLALPLWLGPDYGRQPEWVLSHWWGYVMWMAPCGLLLIAWLWRDRKPWLMASAGIFVVGVLPVSGLVPFTFQYISTVADRYLYLSMLGPALALAWFLSERRWRVTPLVCVPIFGWLAITSAVQTQVWHDKERLWHHALTVNPRSSTAHYNLGNILVDRGELDAAIERYRQAAEIDPSGTDIINNLGSIFLQQGKLEEAIEQYQRAVKINPTDDYAHYNLGKILAKRGEYERAAEHLRRVVEINPADGEAHYDLGRVLTERGDWDKAIEHYRRAVEVNPSDGNWQYELGVALAQRGQHGEAIEHLRKVLGLRPLRHPDKTHFFLATALANKGHLEEAVNHYQQALRIEPEFAEAHEGLGQALNQSGKREEAIQHYEQALRIMKARSAASKPR
ncbi:MAG: tetratricopeptide repeat protein [Deltaproteobacteria bacterium]|nr:tetratricopeptide repeat protein [Deltaproteobacteria bacterium]